MGKKMSFNQCGVTPLTLIEMQETEGGFLKGVIHAIVAAAEWVWSNIDEKEVVTSVVSAAAVDGLNKLVK